MWLTNLLGSVSISFVRILILTVQLILVGLDRKHGRYFESLTISILVASKAIKSRGKHSACLFGLNLFQALRMLLVHSASPHPAMRSGCAGIAVLKLRAGIRLNFRLHSASRNRHVLFGDLFASHFISGLAQITA
jgi:hypothetical protein